VKTPRGTPVVACIPTIGLSPHLRGLCQSLAMEEVETRIYVNSQSVPNSVVEDIVAVGWEQVLHHRPGQSIYQEWNEAAKWACELDAYLLVLNDDIGVAPYFAHALGSALDEFESYGLISADPSHPTPQSTLGASPIPSGFKRGDRRAFANWAFAARPAAWQMIGDFEIWYGDDHLILQVERAGWDVGYQRGTGVFHDTSSTTRQLPWTNEAVARDHVRWAAIPRG